MRRGKYNATKTYVDGVMFHSKREAKRWGELQILEECGEIRELRRQVPFEFRVLEQKVCKYIADFTYWDTAKNRYVVEDSKGYATQLFKLKAKLFRVLYPEYELLIT